MNPFTPGHTVDPQFFAGRKKEIEKFKMFLKNTRQGKVSNLLNRLCEKDCLKKVSRGHYRLFHNLFRDYLRGEVAPKTPT